MPEFKLNIGSKEGKTYTKVIDTDLFLGMKIKDMVNGNEIGLSGYEFVITGGSDKEGFPMRYDYNATGRKRVLLSKGPCIKIKRDGLRIRKTVRGNTISEVIRQINLKVVKEGDKKLADVLGKKEESGEKTVEEKEIKSKEKQKK